MDRDRFWTLIETTQAGSGDDCQQQTSRLTAALRALPPSEIKAFEIIRWQLLAESYRWELWGACSLLTGTDSGNGFEYFRGWLIGQGRAVFEAALHDPDSLAEHPRVQAIGRSSPRSSIRSDLMCESLLYVAYGAYEAVTGEELELTDAEFAQVPDTVGRDPVGEPYALDPAGRQRQCPRLWALFGATAADQPWTSSL